jgi:hypothetical protein
LEFDRLAKSTIHACHGKGKGYYKKALRWMLEAEKRSFGGIILLVDRDGVDSRVGEIDAAQADTITPIHRALGVAIEAFEAWMLADESALSQVLLTNINTQPAPEKISDPKGHFHHVFAEHGRSPSADLYAQLAGILDIGTLEKRCPKGFAVFAVRIREL